MQLRVLNKTGSNAFRTFLAELRKDSARPVPTSLLSDPSTSTPVTPTIELDRPGFKTKRDAAEYLFDKLGPLMAREDVFKEIGLWNWLALFYFDDITPPKSGRRVPGADARYLLRLDDTRYATRHALLTPVLIRSVAPVYNRLLLDTPLTSLGKVIETVMKKLYITRSPGVFEAMELMYLNPATGRAKPGVVSVSRPGNVIKRLPLRLQQLQMTYDLMGLPGARIIALLGREFSSWTTAPVQPVGQ